MIFNIKMYEPKKSYAVVKSTGYESVLRHSHEFVEMVFVESGSAVQKVNSETVELAVKFISDNFYKKISLADVAEYVGLSSGYLQKLFNRERQTSVIEYLLRYRVEQSCKLLIESDKTISEISDVIGFSDIKNFHYAFKRITGITPNEYRRTHKIRSAETKNND